MRRFFAPLRKTVLIVILRARICILRPKELLFCIILSDCGNPTTPVTLREYLPNDPRISFLTSHEFLGHSRESGNPEY